MTKIQIRKAYAKQSLNDFTCWSFIGFVLIEFIAISLILKYEYMPLGVIAAMLGLAILSMCLYRLNLLYKDYRKLIMNKLR